MRLGINVVLLLAVVVVMAGCSTLPEVLPSVTVGGMDPRYRGREHIEAAEAVVVGEVRDVIAHGRPFVSKYSSAILLQRTEIVIAPEYVIKGAFPGEITSVQANLLSYESTRSLGYRPFKPEAGQRWILFLRRAGDWRMLFDLFEAGVRVYSGKPDSSLLNRSGDATMQAAAILVTPGSQFSPKQYCEGLSASVAYAGLLVGRLRVAAMLESVRGSADDCAKRVIEEEVGSSRKSLSPSRK